MKIGIFGDSYADPISKNSTPTWIDILNQRPNIHSSSYAVSGSNMYYSVEQFKKMHKKHDRNIFLVTGPERIWARRIDFMDVRHSFIPGNDTIEHLIEFYKNCKEPERTYFLKILEALRIYFTFIRDYEYEVYLQKLMIQDLLSIDKNLILLPCFKESIPYIPFDVNGCLFDVFEKENLSWGIDYNIQYQIDRRNCHMTAENNKILAEKIIAYIEQGKEIDLNINDFISPNLESKDFYIKEQK